MEILNSNPDNPSKSAQEYTGRPGLGFIFGNKVWLENNDHTLFLFFIEMREWLLSEKNFWIKSQLEMGAFEESSSKKTFESSIICYHHCRYVKR